MISQAAGDATLPVTPAGGGGRRYTTGAGLGVGATAGTVDVAVTLAGGVVTALLASFNSTRCALPDPVAVTLSFHGLAAPLPTAATLELLDEAHTNPLPVWVAAGSPKYSPQALIFAQLAAAQVEPQPLVLTPTADGTVSVNVTLLPYAVSDSRSRWFCCLS